MILSLAILLTPHPGHAAVAATDADVIGKWITDRNDPTSDYVIVAGPTADSLRVLAPAKAVGRKVGETLTLQRVGPGEFATPTGGAIWAKLTVTKARHATFQMKQDDKTSFGIIYILLEKP
ncbi:MAG TPA: hypothetical protein VFE10_01645 [Phenylobacterium sp.]|nr:hypothetical protein [Phenylobacterium sp.]